MRRALLVYVARSGAVRQSASRQRQLENSLRILGLLGSDHGRRGANIGNVATVLKGLTRAEVKAAFRAQAREVHPDVAGAKSTPDKFLDLQLAATLLLEETARAQRAKDVNDSDSPPRPVDFHAELQRVADERSKSSDVTGDAAVEAARFSGLSAVEQVAIATRTDAENMAACHAFVEKWTLRVSKTNYDIQFPQRHRDQLAVLATLCARLETILAHVETNFEKCPQMMEERAAALEDFKVWVTEKHPAAVPQLNELFDTLERVEVIRQQVKAEFPNPNEHLRSWSGHQSPQPLPLALTGHLNLVTSANLTDEERAEPMHRRMFTLAITEADSDGQILRKLLVFELRAVFSRYLMTRVSAAAEHVWWGIRDQRAIWSAQLGIEHDLWENARWLSRSTKIWAGDCALTHRCIEAAEAARREHKEWLAGGRSDIITADQMAEFVDDIRALGSSVVKTSSSVEPFDHSDLDAAAPADPPCRFVAPPPMFAASGGSGGAGRCLNPAALDFIDLYLVGGDDDFASNRRLRVERLMRRGYRVVRSYSQSGSYQQHRFVLDIQLHRAYAAQMSRVVRAVREARIIHHIETTLRDRGEVAKARAKFDALAAGWGLHLIMHHFSDLELVAFARLPMTCFDDAFKFLCANPELTSALAPSAEVEAARLELAAVLGNDVEPLFHRRLKAFRDAVVSACAVLPPHHQQTAPAVMGPLFCSLSELDGEYFGLQHDLYKTQLFQFPREFLVFQIREILASEFGVDLSGDPQRYEATGRTEHHVLASELVLRALIESLHINAAHRLLALHGCRYIELPPSTMAQNFWPFVKAFVTSAARYAIELAAGKAYFPDVYSSSHSAVKDEESERKKMNSRGGKKRSLASVALRQSASLGGKCAASRSAPVVTFEGQSPEARGEALFAKGFRISIVSQPSITIVEGRLCVPYTCSLDTLCAAIDSGILSGVTNGSAASP